MYEYVHGRFNRRAVNIMVHHYYYHNNNHSELERCPASRSMVLECRVTVADFYNSRTVLTRCSSTPLLARLRRAQGHAVMMRRSKIKSYEHHYYNSTTAAPRENTFGRQKKRNETRLGQRGRAVVPRVLPVPVPCLACHVAPA